MHPFHFAGPSPEEQLTLALEKHCGRRQYPSMRQCVPALLGLLHESTMRPAMDLIGAVRRLMLDHCVPVNPGQLWACKDGKFDELVNHVVDTLTHLRSGSSLVAGGLGVNQASDWFG